MTCSASGDTHVKPSRPRPRRDRHVSCTRLQTDIVKFWKRSTVRAALNKVNLKPYFKPKYLSDSLRARGEKRRNNTQRG